MSYGERFDDVGRVLRPERKETEYGYYREIVRGGLLVREVFIEGGKKTPKFHPNAVYISEGRGRAILNAFGNEKEVCKNDILICGEQPCALEMFEGGRVYHFSPRDSYVGGGSGRIEQPFDVRKKYWGKIETLFNGDISGKRMEIKKGVIGSMEYHMKKREVYFVQSGRVATVLRTGRAEDRPVVLEQGEGFAINPGTMHRRIALEDSVVFEISTRDEDSDSRLVEEGERYLKDDGAREKYLKETGLWPDLR